ncbi:transcriptional regulator, GntR family [Shuttleworthella sp. MSX8B]|uniref:GntR family transcriptional regulator n=1 Tax=Shuttleworthella sp. MSX8B TaxID=936574 RepID=UPI00044A80D3|nr:GntR family transcriptional regulator [Shuttleworthia sp. MSX8B]EUB12657.1 transcriptional regulator, GntR family [Shuttleworthia sp. MSX8B]
MILRIEEGIDIPIYQQIRNQIVYGISSGALAAGEQLPTVRALAAEIGVNVMTVSKAYQTLKAEGYIVTERKRGARVREKMTESKRLSLVNRRELERIISEARLSGMKRADFIQVVDQIYAEVES